MDEHDAAPRTAGDATHLDEDDVPSDEMSAALAELVAHLPPRIAEWEKLERLLSTLLQPSEPA